MQNTCKLGDRGFTLVELLIVVIVVGIIATISVASYNGVQAKTRATALAVAIKDVEDAFLAGAAHEGQITWWRDTVFTGANNPVLADILGASPSIRMLLSEVPGVSGLNLTWTYDNDGDARSVTACDAVGTTSWNGVVLAIGGLNDNIIKSADGILDDGNPLCGKVRYGNVGKTTMLYQLGFTQKIE